MEGIMIQYHRYQIKLGFPLEMSIDVREEYNERKGENNFHLLTIYMRYIINFV